MPTTHPSRAEQVEMLLEQLRPKLEATARDLIEQALDVPEAEEFGAIDLKFRDAGQELATEIRQAAVSSHKKRGTKGPA